MAHPILADLAPYRARRRARAAVAGAVVGLLAAAVAAGLAAWAGVPRGVVAALLLGVPVVGVIAGLAWPQRWPAVAADVDAAAGLDDRLVAAVEFATLPTPAPVHELQLRDASRRLAEVPRGVVSLRPPRGWPVTVIAYALAAGLWLLSGSPAPVRAETPEHVLAAADMLDAIADELEQDAVAEGSSELKALAAELRKTAEELRQPGCDVAKALAKVSVLQDEAAAKLSSNEQEAARVAAGMKALGGAMQSARPLREAGKALEQGRYARAAKALGAAATARFDPKDARSAADDLNKAADKLDAERLPTLSEPARQMAKGAAGDPDELKRGAESLARQARDQERRQRLNLLTARLHRLLTECKEQMQRRNLMQQQQQQQSGSKGQAGDPKAAAPFEVPNKDELRKKLEDPTFRNKVEALLKKFDPDGTGEIEEGPGTDDPTDPARPRTPATARDRARALERRLEEALQREKVPVVYHEAVKNYFRRLAQLDAPIGP